MGDGLSLKSLHDLPGPLIAVIPHRRSGAAVSMLWRSTAPYGAGLEQFACRRMHGDL